MKIILRESIENLGKRGDIVNVARGYGRNFLIPRKLAIEVTPSNMKMVEQQQRALRKKLEKEVQTYKEQIEKFNQIHLTFTRKSGDKESIFGSVSLTDISKALEEKGFDIEKKKILLAEPIKKLGNYRIPIKVFHDERAEINVEVLKEGGEEEQPSAQVEPIPVEPAPVNAVSPEEPSGEEPSAEAPLEPPVEESPAEGGDMEESGTEEELKPKIDEPGE